MNKSLINDPKMEQMLNASTTADVTPSSQTIAKPNVGSSLIGQVARLTKQQTNRSYFSEMPIGTKFIIVEEHLDMPAYDLTGYFLNYPPQKLTNGMFHYTGYIEKGSWETVGTISEIVKELRS